MDDEAEDINGTPVYVGSRVRVLRISEAVLSQLSEADAEATRAMQGAVLEVNEIDEFGGAWVEDSWQAADGTMGPPPCHAPTVRQIGFAFADAMRAFVRQDPDVILVGEMRDLETISIAIETAETGHLVFGTLHTTTAMSTVDRIIDQFPADRQAQIRTMLASSLKGVVAQTLCKKKPKGRVAALEVLIATKAVSALIREGKTHQLMSQMQMGGKYGMRLLNDALCELVQKGLVDPHEAYLKAIEKEALVAQLQHIGVKLDPAQLGDPDAGEGGGHGAPAHASAHTPSAAPASPAPVVRTTLDLGLQRFLGEQLDETLAVHEAAVAMGIVLDVASGAVLALDAREAYPIAPFAPIAHVFTTGSTFKALTMAVALEEGVRFFVTALGNPAWVVKAVHAVGGDAFEHDALA